VLRDYLRELGRAARRGLDQTDSYAVLVAILLGVVSYWVPSIQPVADTTKGRSWDECPVATPMSNMNFGTRIPERRPIRRLT